MQITKRDMLAAAGTAAASVAFDPHGARRLGAERAISRSRRPDSRPKLCEISHRSGHGRAHRHGLPLE